MSYKKANGGTKKSGVMDDEEEFDGGDLDDDMLLNPVDLDNQTVDDNSMVKKEDT